MKEYIVRKRWVEYRTVTIEADSVEEALEKAWDLQVDEYDWPSLDYDDEIVSVELKEEE